jgi:hypothetical protein
MSAAPGYNPLRHDCKNGENCFNRKYRPKIELFAECFAPTRCNFGDVDGLIERNGLLLLLEWKSPASAGLSTGQVITYRAFSRIAGNAVIVVVGDAETMTVEKYCVFWKGKQRQWVPVTLEGLRAVFRRWWNWANSCPDAIEELASEFLSEFTDDPTLLIAASDVCSL